MTDRELVEALLGSPHISTVAITDRAAARITTLSEEVARLNLEIARLNAEVLRQMSWKTAAQAETERLMGELDRLRNKEIIYYETPSGIRVPIGKAVREGDTPEPEVEPVVTVRMMYKSDGDD